ncbi:MAG: hypothetical protein RLZZ356_507, partial [Verrucomicrobiota bacterium]
GLVGPSRRLDGAVIRCVTEAVQGFHLRSPVSTSVGGSRLQLFDRTSGGPAWNREQAIPLARFGCRLPSDRVYFGMREFAQLRSAEDRGGRSGFSNRAHQWFCRTPVDGADCGLVRGDCGQPRSRDRDGTKLFGLVRRTGIPGVRLRGCEVLPEFGRSGRFTRGTDRVRIPGNGQGGARTRVQRLQIGGRHGAGVTDAALVPSGERREMCIIRLEMSAASRTPGSPVPTRAPRSEAALVELITLRVRAISSGV